MKKKTGKIIRTIVMIICIGVFCFSAYELIKIIMEYNAGSQEYQKLESYTAQPVENDTSSGAKGFSVNYEGLRQINEEIVGWIRIPDTTINYPIMQTDDNEYYLKHTFERKNNIAGSIFLDKRNTSDFSDRNTIIYGHHIKNGKMFADLRHYTDENFYQEHPIIYLNTPEEGNVEYEIFSFYLTGNYRDTYGRTYSYQFANDEEYQAYLDMITAQSQYDTGVPVSIGDNILTLSTCTNRTDDERYIVHAKKVNQ